MIGRPKGSKNTAFHRYSKEEKEYLDEIIPGHSYKEIGILFKNKFDVELTRGQLKGVVNRSKNNTGLNGHFKKGGVPFNKGKKQSDYMSQEAIERTKGTRFKKGHTNTNHKPVGSERTDKDGYILIKTAEPSKWEFKHKWVWEQHNGKVPKGYAVIFLDGNRANITLDNLMLVSRRQLLVLNRHNLLKDNV